MKKYSESIEKIKNNNVNLNLEDFNMDKYANIIEIEKTKIFKNMKKDYYMYVSSLELTNVNQIIDSLQIIAIVSLKILSIITQQNAITIIENNHTLFENKNNDYGNSFTDFGIIGIIVRLNDKINRILNLTKKSKIRKVDEKIEDTINDLYNYCMIGLMFE